MRGNSFFSRSSARTISATVCVGWVSCAISGSAFIAATTFGSREKSSFLRLQHVRVRRDVAQSLEHGQREVGRRHLEREALADQPGELGLVFERVEAGHARRRRCGRAGTREGPARAISRAARMRSTSST